MYIYKYLSLKTLVYTSALLTPILAPTLSIAAAEAGVLVEAEAEEEPPVKAYWETKQISEDNFKVELKLSLNRDHRVFSSIEDVEAATKIVLIDESEWKYWLKKEKYHCRS